jgi:membrane associated rhomboid family serine protease
MLLLYCVIATLGLALLPELGAFALFPYEYYDTFFSREFILSVVLFQFLHGGIFHLLMNTVFLYIYGNLIEMLL